LFVDGQRVMPERAIALGYRFNYPELDSALRNLLGAAP
jgi:NAD dependent epimerase/dehydratase family enzyme